MWAINNKTGVKFDMTEEYYNQFYFDNPDMEKLATKDPIKPKTTMKELKQIAKESGVTGSDRMNREELEAILKED